MPRNFMIIGIFKKAYGKCINLLMAFLSRIQLKQFKSQPIVQPEGQAAAQPEGQPAGQAVVQPEGQPAGQAVVQPEGQPAGQVAAQPEGQPAGQVATQPETQSGAHQEGHPGRRPNDISSFRINVEIPSSEGAELDNPDLKPLNQQLEYLEKERYKDDTEHRKTLVHWVMETSNLWLACVIFILILAGFKFLDLSDAVLTTMLATATATVLGLPLVVLRGLFGEGKENKK